MELKKNPKANVGRNSSLYFAIGLALMLFLTNFAINYKTYDKSTTDIGVVSMDQELEEEIPITNQLQTPPPPPPPPAAPEVIEIVKDEVEVVETVIQSTESNQEQKIVKVEAVKVAPQVEEDVEVPFAVIENVPVFPGCESGNNDAKKACMSQKIQDFVNKKFNTELASELGLSGRQRINVIFKIDKTGAVTGIRARAPHPGLEKEAERVINMLPKMQPGKQRGKPVTVPYSLPIVFVVQE
ncbi:energy transducer TonB [Mariniflexile maritimum]|jgi:protein TonB|uniref:energy transducer TonB n=1 Tax=Mariniflexile maritimum TaxID=2682493 RepID=UPI0012F6AE94|nr:energy transducer TonB [Mariniflexile maritimum]MCB0448605.1 energy transducer TonB [Confluentibacter sp.]HMQ44146.1 energy transducer TonB [Mariniflexile sp.]HMR15458.1 energy transducer TonB [Mariniflexile sp.]